jgi:tRNA A37 threonylcarbamoyladenosine dehydratase
MTTCDINERFGGIRRVYGDQGAMIIRDLHVCVVGVGGVGSWAVEALARSGVGRLTLIDHDEVCVTNTNRQLHALTSTLGQSKCEVLAARCRDINPEITMNVIDDFLTMQTLEAYLDRGYDYVIDAIDSIKFKAAMINWCKRNKQPIVTTGGAGGMTDPTMIQVADLWKTYNDPLAAKVRASLKKNHGITTKPGKTFGVDCVFSSQQPVYPKADGTVSHEKPGIHGVSLDCRFGYGAASVVTPVFGFMAASRVINRVLAKHARK